MSIEDKFTSEHISTFDFNPNQIAPSLSKVKLSDFSSPDTSWLMDEGSYMETPDKQTGLNPLQTRFLREKIEADFSDADTFWRPHYDKMRTDWDFYGAKDQWTEEAKEARRGRPILTIPVLAKFVKRVVAETKKNPPAVKLTAREDGDIEKAEIGMGLVRYIEDTCGAKYAYAHALESAAVGGLGWIKGGYDAKHGKVIISRVADPFRYYIDPNSEEIDGSDAKYFIGRYKKTVNRKVQSCYEYWWKETNEETGLDEVYWALAEGDKIVDYGRFPSSILPLFPVFGERLDYDGELVLKGMIRDLEDAQRFYNYMKSQEAETISLTPKAPIMAEEGTIPKERERDWNNCTKNPTKVLFYRATNLDGEPTTNKPEFMSMKADTEWMRQAAIGAVQDLKEVTGIYDTALGSDSKELSGKAIIAKQITADAGQFTYTEHLQDTIQNVGRWLMEIIPYVYYGQRLLRIVGEDGKLRSVDLDNPMGENTPPEEQIPIDLDFSEFDISVSSGNSYATRREAGVDAFQSIMQSIPNTATAIADLAVKNMDIPYAQEAAQRLHAMLPQEIKEEEKAPKGFVPAAQLQKTMQMFDQAKQLNMQIQQQKDAKIEALEAELKNQIQGRIAAERIKGEYNLAKAQITEMNANQREALKVQADVEKTSADIQTRLLQEVGARSKAIAEETSIKEDVKAASSMQNNQEPYPPTEEDKTTQPKALSFEKPTLNEDPLSNTDMLMNL